MLVHPLGTPPEATCTAWERAARDRCAPDTLWLAENCRRAVIASRYPWSIPDDQAAFGWWGLDEPHGDACESVWAWVDDRLLAAQHAGVWLHGLHWTAPLGVVRGLLAGRRWRVWSLAEVDHAL